MSTNDRNAFGFDDPNRGPLDRAANAMDGRDDPNRGPLDRAENAMTGHDDPNRGPLDRAANAITGGTGGVSAAMHHDDPNRGPLDRTQNAMTGHDDPNRGPLDRTQNAMTGHDDPNRGPLDRTANAITGGTGGVAAATSSHGSTSYGSTAGGTGSVASALFDSQDEAQRAVAELRQSGVNDGALSIIAQKGRTMTTRDVDGEVTDEEHTNVLRGILGGGALGAGLGIAALAIPGVGPLAALGAIAASAAPEAMAIGAAVGATAGTFNEVLKKHGVDDDDAAYYGRGMKDGGVLVTADVGPGEASRVRDILYRHGGHSASRARVTA